MGEGWTVEEDNSTLELDLSTLPRLALKSVIKEGTRSILGTEKIQRLQEEKFSCLGFSHLVYFWENQERIPENWKELDGVYFDATQLVDPLNSWRYVFGLGWHYHKWCWRYRWLARRWNAREPSVGLI